VTEAVNRYHTAKGYFQSCIMIERSPERNTEDRRMLTVLSMMMLTGFSLELYFKAWLLAKGKTSEQVRGYNHEISNLYRDCKATGLVVDRLDNLVDKVAVQHQDFTYRYIGADAVIPLLDWNTTFQILDALDTRVDEAVGASALYGLQAGH